MKNRYKPVTDWRILIPVLKMAAVWVVVIVLAIYVTDTSGDAPAYRILQDVDPADEESDAEYQEKYEKFMNF
jgi:anti-sigma-K factor RskA